jgi:hypothetical protein
LVLVAGQAAATTHTPPWADAITSHYAGTGGLDTRQSGTKMVNRLGGHGWLASNDVGITAATSVAQYYAPDDAVWEMFGHAGAGGISTYNTGVGGWTWLFATSAVGSCASPNACLTGRYSALHQVRNMAFVGCDSADSSHGYDLLTTAYTTDGVDSALGFSGTIYWPMGDQWSDSYNFWPTFNSESVSAAAWDAALDVHTVYGGYYGFDTLVTKGGSVSIEPPGYGS